MKRLTKHKALVNTNFDPTGYVHDQLRKRNIRTIAKYDVVMSDIAKELETVNYLNNKMYVAPNKQPKEQDNPLHNNKTNNKITDPLSPQSSHGFHQNRRSLLHPRRNATSAGLLNIPQTVATWINLT